MESTERLFAERLRVKRSMLGMSQRTVVKLLAAHAGLRMDTSALARIEIGARRISLDEAVAISAVLGVDLPYMTQEDVPSDLVDYLRSVAAAELDRISPTSGYVSRLDVYRTI